MAELTSAAETTANSCCASEAQVTCCEPSAKTECCDPSHGEGCGCAADTTDIGGTVRVRYAAAATLREVARVLRPGGRFAVSDVIVDESMDDANPRRHAGIHGLHRRSAHPPRVQALADAGPLTLTYARLTVSTLRQPQPSSAPASQSKQRDRLLLRLDNFHAPSIYTDIREHWSRVRTIELPNQSRRQRIARDVAAHLGLAGFVLQTLAFIVVVGRMPMLALGHVPFGYRDRRLGAATLGILRL